MRYRGAQFEPLMTLYLTDRTSPAEVDRAKASGLVRGFKLYPAGATTHSDAGVTDIRKVESVLARMSEVGLVLQVHGEVTDPDVDVFDREARFIDSVLTPTVERFPRLKIVFEHVTTSAAARFVLHAREGVAATVTPQHLMMNRNALFMGGIRPHLYCLPVLKTEADRRTLLDVIASGNPRFFLGTDSAPHARHTKEHACGCAGIFSAPCGYRAVRGSLRGHRRAAQVGGIRVALRRRFLWLAAELGKDHPRKDEWDVPAHYPFGSAEIVPLRAGERIAWRMANGSMHE